MAIGKDHHLVSNSRLETKMPRYGACLSLPYLFLLGLLFVISLPSLLPRSRRISLYQFHRGDIKVPLPETTGTVNWRKCDGPKDLPGTDCGYILVPMDYFNKNAGVARVALGRYRASSSKQKRGMVLFNPGGPGVYAKRIITQRGYVIQSLVGEEYDIVGFDPRGVGESYPKVQCFNPNFPHRKFAQNTVLDRGYDMASNLTLEEARRSLFRQQVEADALYRTQLDLCRQSMATSLGYMGTSTVVRDMDFITRALEGQDSLINYYGGSYGSILGQYLVNMLPDRVRRVAIDGIVDVELWAGEPAYKWHRQWLSSTEETYKNFLTGCSKAGPAVCPLARFKDEDPSLIENRIENFTNDLYYQPQAVSNTTGPGILTVGRVQNSILASLESPLSWPAFSKALAKAMGGDPSDMLVGVPSSLGGMHRSRITHPRIPHALEDYLRPPLLPLPRTAARPKIQDLYVDLERLGVSCNDQPPFEHPSTDIVVDEMLYVYKNVSRFVFAAITTEPDLGCEYWPATPPERFNGPWNHTLRNPMLVISNTADPITPIASGKKTAKLMGSSARLLIQNSPGHTFASDPSLCTTRFLRQYFADGTLPPESTVCEPDFPPFGAEDRDLLSKYSDEELQTLRGLKMLGELKYSGFR